jgi:hypothetical protein
MPINIAVDEYGSLGIPTGTTLGADALSDPNPNDTVTSWVVHPTHHHIIIPTPADVQGFLLPSLYDLLPQIIRDYDINLVERGDVALYFWDSVPVWDGDPYTWDEVIGPEPILKTTTRLWQLELERCREDIRRLTDLYNIRECPEKYINYLTSVYGLTVPSSNLEVQREFLIRLPDVQRMKGSVRSFTQLFEALGFDVTLIERYQRRGDFGYVDGPQIRRVQTDEIKNEPLGVTIASAGPYRFDLMYLPVERGTLEVRVYDQSAVTPTVVRDDGQGGWSGASTGVINYTTGVCTLTLPAVPTLIGQPINGTYRAFPDSFPDPFHVKYEDRVRSSVASVTLIPVNSSVTLTPELNSRLDFYINLLKPAHVVFRDFTVQFSEEEDDSVDDSLYPVQATLIVESHFGTLYRGYGWDSITENGSLYPDPAFLGIGHRDQGEYLRYPVSHPIVAERDPTETYAPYVYPFLHDGRFTQPESTTDYEWNWGDQLDTFDSVVTNDHAPSTSTLSISKLTGTALGVGDWICFTDGPAGGEGGQITNFTSHGTHYEVTIGSLLTDVPCYYQDYEYVKLQWPDGVNLAFSGTLTNLPASIGGTDLSYTIGGVDYVVTDNGAGAFVAATITAGTINYVTGAVAVTFTAPPDFTTSVQVRYTGSQFNGFKISPRAIAASSATIYFNMDVTGVPVQFSETDNGAGGFTNVNGYLTSAAIDYDTGELDLVFTVPPVRMTSILIDYTEILPVIPVAGNTVTIISDLTVGRTGLEIRAEDPLSIVGLATPYTVSGGAIFSGATIDSVNTLLPTGVTITYDIGAGHVHVTDNGVGQFIAASIVSSTLNYVTGRFDITFTVAPISDVDVEYYTYNSTNLGVL